MPGCFDCLSPLAEIAEEELGRAPATSCSRSTSRAASSAPRRRCRELRENSGLHGLHRVGRWVQFGRRRRALHRLEACGRRADPPTRGRARSRDPGQRRGARRHDDRSARAVRHCRQRRPLAIRRIRRRANGCAPAIRCRSRSSPPTSPAPMCFWRRGTMPAASPAASSRSMLARPCACRGGLKTAARSAREATRRSMMIRWAPAAGR